MYTIVAVFKLLVALYKFMHFSEVKDYFIDLTRSASATDTLAQMRCFGIGMYMI